jgi:hypothetical protein
MVLDNPRGQRQVLDQPPIHALAPAAGHRQHPTTLAGPPVLPRIAWQSVRARNRLIDRASLSSSGERIVTGTGDGTVSCSLAAWCRGRSAAAVATGGRSPPRNRSTSRRSRSSSPSNSRE